MSGHLDHGRPEDRPCCDNWQECERTRRDVATVKAPPHRRARTDYPAGVVAILDNGGKTTDRYTVVYTPYTHDGQTFPFRSVVVYPLVNMSGAPFHPQGVCMHGETIGHRPTAGWGTGQRVIAFDDLPTDCQRVVRQDLKEDET